VIGTCRGCRRRQALSAALALCIACSHVKHVVDVPPHIEVRTLDPVAAWEASLSYGATSSGSNVRLFHPPSDWG